MTYSGSTAGMNIRIQAVETLLDRTVRRFRFPGRGRRASGVDRQAIRRDHFRHHDSQKASVSGAISGTDLWSPAIWSATSKAREWTA